VSWSVLLLFKKEDRLNNADGKKRKKLTKQERTGVLSLFGLQRSDQHTIRAEKVVIRGTIKMAVGLETALRMVRMDAAVRYFSTTILDEVTSAMRRVVGSA
jgi:hypothetical protein